jgi:hypothetical protein
MGAPRSKPVNEQAKARLLAALEHVRAQHAQRAASPSLADRLDRLARFQSRRLAATYADLARERRYAAAIAFFGSDIYGPGDYSRRDADLARMVPSMVRLLPEDAVATIADAVELSALAQDLDRALDAALADSALTVSSYCQAFRAGAGIPERERQIALTVHVGRGLDRYVHTPLLRQALTMMRVPARMAGLSALQRFLERGVAAFARMKNADEFLETIRFRETAILRAIFAGDDAAFPDPGTNERA